MIQIRRNDTNEVVEDDYLCIQGDKVYKLEEHWDKIRGIDVSDQYHIDTGVRSESIPLKNGIDYICSNCHTRISYYDNYCKDCGSKVNWLLEAK